MGADQPRAFRVGRGDLGVLIPGRHGWAFWDIDPDLDVRVQLADGADRLRLVAVLVRSRTGLEDVSGTELRRVPLGRLAAAIRDDSLADGIRMAWHARPGLDLRPESSTPLEALLIRRVSA